MLRTEETDDYFCLGVCCTMGLLVAQLVKNPPAMRETWVSSLGWEDPLEEGMATHPSILVRRIPMDSEARWTALPGAPKS